MAQDFRDRIINLAKRSVDAAPRCANEESTKMFLVLPFISLLGYDHTNPDEVFPEHHCDFSEKYKNRVDFAILRNGSPVIAVECKQNGAAMRDDRGQLKSYFNAAPSVKMGVLTDGTVWEFYADSDEPNMMDDQPFLALEMKDIAKGKVNDSAIEAIQSLSKDHFDPENIGAEARRKHVFNYVLAQVAILTQEPSEPFARMLLQGAGIQRVSQRVLDEYRPLIQSAFKEFINQEILKRLDLPKPDALAPVPVSIEQAPLKPEERSSTTETELFIYDWVRHRLAFLVKDDKLFSDLENVQFKDYQGKMAVFYKMERRGRLFDFYEKKNGAIESYRFVFPSEFAGDASDIVTTKLTDIDGPLLKAFTARVQLLG